MTAAAATMPWLEQLPAALLVDLDGTIADSRPALRACFDSFLRARRIEVRPGDFERFDGVSLPEIPEALRARYGIDEPLDELRREYEEAVEKAYAAVEPAPGTRELVRVAHDAGVALALVTSAPRRLATDFLASSGLLASFAAVVAGEDAPSKPDPGLFLMALRRVRVAPDEAIAVEDSPAGVASALGAGLRVVGVSSEPARGSARGGRCTAGAERPVPARVSVRRLHRHDAMSAACLVAAPPLDFRFSGDDLEVPAELRGRIDELWLEEKSARPSVHDGTLLSVRDVRGGVVTVCRCSYRHLVAQERDETIRQRLGIQALAVSGIVVLGAADSRVLVGRRSQDVTEYPGAWELIPSGGVGWERVGGDGGIDVLGALLEELEQEAGIPGEAVATARCVGLVHDVTQGGYDVCFVLEVPDAEPSRRPEYADMAVVPVSEARRLIEREESVPTSRVLLDLAADVGLV